MPDSDKNIEKVRFERLKLVCRKALKQLIKKSLSIEQIKTCYPLIASTEEGVESLEIARSQMIKWWLSSSLKEFDLIFSERDIENKLDELDKIIQTAQQRKRLKIEQPVEIEKLSPTEIINSMIVSSTYSSIENLTAIYNQLRIDNGELLERLQGLATESNEIKNDINELFQTLAEEINALKEEESKIRLDSLIETYMNVQD